MKGSGDGKVFAPGRGNGGGAKQKLCTKPKKSTFLSQFVPKIRYFLKFYTKGTKLEDISALSTVFLGGGGGLNYRFFRGGGGGQ